MFEINTLPNSLSLLIKQLRRAKYRNEENLLLVEGTKCCEELLQSHYKPHFVVIDKDKRDSNLNALVAQFEQNKIKIYETKNSIFDKLCDSNTPQGILAIAEQKDDKLIPNNSFVILDNIADPGNVGTIIRTAEWFGVSQILLLGDCADKYNPKVIRSSMGSIFRMNIVKCKDIEKIIQKQFYEIPIFAASLDASINLKNINIPTKFGLIVGNETRGISDYLKNIITTKFIIEGFSETESLNVAVACGISLFHLTASQP